MTKRRAMTTLAMATLFAQQAGISPQWPLKQPQSLPLGYHVHIPKAQRKGKTWQELQAVRRGKV